MADVATATPPAAEASATVAGSSISNTVYVVTGFKRSGTSLMMRCLTSVPGIEPHYDPAYEEYLRADYPAKNPYFMEDKQVVHEGFDAATLRTLGGKAVKVFAYGMESVLAAAEHCPEMRLKVVIMRRDMSCIMASIKVYKAVPTDGHRTVEEDERLLREVDWDSLRARCDGLVVSYDELVESPSQEARRLATYLGVACDVGELAKAVDPSLRNHRPPAATE